MISFVEIFFFFSSKQLWFFYIYWDLSESCLDLMFQVFKCLKWRVQPQTSILTRKKPILEMLYIFFWAFLCSSCFFCLQASTEEHKHMHMRFSFHLMFLLWISFFFFCFLKWTGMVLYVFFLSCKWFLASS